MIQELKGIAEAFANTLNPKEEMLRIAEARLTICGACPEKNMNSCNVCGCYIPSIARATYQKDCPLKKWKRAVREPYDDGLPKKADVITLNPVKGVDNPITKPNDV